MIFKHLFVFVISCFFADRMIKLHPEWDELEKMHYGSLWFLLFSSILMFLIKCL